MPAASVSNNYRNRRIKYNIVKRTVCTKLSAYLNTSMKISFFNNFSSQLVSILPRGSPCFEKSKSQRYVKKSKRGVFKD